MEMDSVCLLPGSRPKSQDFIATLSLSRGSRRPVAGAQPRARQCGARIGRNVSKLMSKDTNTDWDPTDRNVPFYESVRREVTSASHLVCAFSSALEHPIPLLLPQRLPPTLRQRGGPVYQTPLCPESRDLPRCQTDKSVRMVRRLALDRLRRPV